MSNYKFSQRSLDNMVGVHPDLLRVAQRAIEITKVDFGVTQGLRTEEQQRQFVESGASKTMNSRHLTGHAIDVVAYIGSNIAWDWPLYVTIAEAFQQTARELAVPIVWGGCWKNIQHVNDLDDAVAEYVARKRKQGKKPLMDGPHFELLWTAYPKDSN